MSAYMIWLNHNRETIKNDNPRHQYDWYLEESGRTVETSHRPQGNDPHTNFFHQALVFFLWNWIFFFGAEVGGKSGRGQARIRREDEGVREDQADTGRWRRLVEQEERLQVQQVCFHVQSDQGGEKRRIYRHGWRHFVGGREGRKTSQGKFSPPIFSKACLFLPIFPTRFFFQFFPRRVFSSNFFQGVSFSSNFFQGVSFSSNFSHEVFLPIFSKACFFFQFFPRGVFSSNFSRKIQYECIIFSWDLLGCIVDIFCSGHWVLRIFLRFLVAFSAVETRGGLFKLRGGVVGLISPSQCVCQISFSLIFFPGRRVVLMWFL